MTRIIMKNDNGEVKVSPIDVEKFQKLGYKRKEAKATLKASSKAASKKEN